MPGSTYRTVLVGTDGSSSSLRAVDRAAVISRNAGAQLLIACAATKGAAPGASEQDGAPAAVQDALRGGVDRARAAGADNIDTLLLYGDPVDELARAATERDVDLVVVGNRGINSLAGRLLGSVPANLSHRVSCDVLIVHTTGQNR
jgi:nucleotide-binding universal stress UspA family protein